MYDIHKTYVDLPVANHPTQQIVTNPQKKNHIGRSRCLASPSLSALYIPKEVFAASFRTRPLKRRGLPVY